MKRSKREENSIIIHFMFYFVLIVGLLVFLFTNIFPKILKIETEKTLTKDTYDSIVQIEKKGLTFKEFQKLTANGEKDRVVIEILKNMTKEFYDENLVNETNNFYTVFLEEKNKELSSVQNTLIVDEQIKQISVILPSYSIPPIDLSGDLLTDYKFINYVESLIETFGLSTKSGIGIKKLVLVEEYLGSNSEGGSMDANLYYIPLNLSLKGDKTGIINFLYFIENVGNIAIDQGEIILNKDYGFLSQNGRKMILEGEESSSEYNIFEHQMIDIERITMESYLDSSYIDRGESDYKNFIIKNQGGEEFDIDINLSFYVKGQPIYKTQEFITKIFNNQKKALSLISLKLKDTKIPEIERRKLMKYKTTLSQMNKEILENKKSFAKNEKINELYKNAVRLNAIIEPIFNSLK